MPLTDAALDHVAVAVDDVDAALSYWAGVGAVPVSGGVGQGFRSEQIRFSNGAKLELIGRAPDRPDAFIGGFLDRFGSGTIHHVTVKVPGSIRDAAATLAADGIDVVDLRDDWPYWHEAFVRPSVVGGLVAQVAWSAGTDADWARQTGRPTPPPPDPAAPALTDVVLEHDDLEAAGAVWTTLGATVTVPEDGDGRPGNPIVTWPGSPLRLFLVQAERRGPAGLRFSGHGPAGQTAIHPVLLP